MFSTAKVKKTREIEREDKDRWIDGNGCSN